MQSPVVIQIADSSRIAEVRRIVLAMAASEGLDENAASNSAIVATELATNLSKHAKKGEIQVLPLSPRGIAGVEILSIDQGPGIANIQQCLADGYSTVGTAGTGLGAVQRLSTQTDVYSVPGRGTILAARVMRDKASPLDLQDFLLGVAAKPVHGETVSGDAWAVRGGPNFRLIVVADGLGHGPSAAEASNEAVRVFLKSSEESPVQMVQQIHMALQGTRGAAVSIARIEFDQAQVRFAGLGNVAGVVINADAPGSPKSMISQNGTAGHQARNVKEFLYRFGPADLIIMHSDGLSSHWNLQTSPGLLKRHPSIVAGSLYRDYSRTRDDVCVVVGARR